jgi:hypothetical protein
MPQKKNESLLHYDSSIEVLSAKQFFCQYLEGMTFDQQHFQYDERGFSQRKVTEFNRHQFE